LWGRSWRLRRLSVGVDHSNVKLVQFSGIACSSIVSFTIIILDHHLIHGDGSEHIFIIDNAFREVICDKSKEATGLTIVTSDLYRILQEFVGIKSHGEAAGGILELDLKKIGR
jgi:hypothetical protein